MLQQEKSGNPITSRLEMTVVSFALAILCVPVAIVVSMALVLFGILSLVGRRGKL